jgi:predicted nucleotidyltransferase
VNTKRTNLSTAETLVDIITQAVAPDKVILFGSQAQGTSSPESDYDFLVVMSHVKNERQISRRIYRALLEHHVDVAVDIIVVDAEKLCQRRDTPGLIYHQALAEGEVCYDRAAS